MGYLETVAILQWSLFLYSDFINNLLFRQSSCIVEFDLFIKFEQKENHLVDLFIKFEHKENHLAMVGPVHDDTINQEKKCFDAGTEGI